MLAGIIVEQVGRRLADALPEAFGGLLQFSRLHVLGDGFGLLQGFVPGLHGEYGLQGVRGPIPVPGIDLGEDVALEVHHASLVAGAGQQFAHGGHEAGAPVSRHQSHALQPSCEHALDERAPAFRVLLHALRHGEYLPVAVHADADGDQDAHVLRRAAPAALVPHAVHEQVRVLLPQGPAAPFVDVGVYLPELVGEGLRGHAVAPQQLADVVDLTRGHAGQVHVDQRLLDALLAPPVAFDHGRLEHRALEFRHLETHPAGLDGQVALVVAGPIRLPLPAALIACGAGDLVGLRVKHRVQGLLDAFADHPVQCGLQHGLVDL